MTATIQNGHLIIDIPIQQPRLSKTGNTMIIAGTGGFVQTGLEVEGKPVKLSVNAIIPK